MITYKTRSRDKVRVDGAFESGFLDSLSEEVKAKYSKATFGESFVTAKARYEFRGLRVNGERASVNEEETEQKMLVIREKIIKSLAGPADVWNWDETGLIYRSTDEDVVLLKIPQY